MFEKNLVLRLLFPFVLIISLSFLIGCDDSIDDDGISVNPEAAIEKIGEANEALGSELYNLINNVDETENPDDIDMTVPYNIYKAALVLDPDNTTANFGVAILEILMISQDTEFQNLFNRIEDFMENGSFFEAGGDSEAAGNSPGNPLLNFHLNRVPISLGEPAKIADGMTSFRTISESDPTVSEIQDIIETKLLPRFNTAIDLLDKVTEHNDFIFTVTPEMQGDYNEDKVELDLAEVYAALAGINLTKAQLCNFISYDFDFISYDGAGLVEAFRQDSDFMGLRSNGTTNMSNARQAWDDGVTALRDGIEFLENETDNQSDDLIRIDQEDGILQKDLDSLKSNIPKALAAINSSTELTSDWDDDSETPDVALEISLANFFNSPIENFKGLLPAYTVSLDSQQSSGDWTSEPVDAFASITISDSGYYSWQRSIEFDDGDTAYFYEDINFDVSDWESYWDNSVETYRDYPYAYIYMQFEGYLEPGNHDLYCNGYIEYEESSGWYHVPRITWEADSFEEWINGMPDVTFGGLFPGIGSVAEFRNLFGIEDVDDWEKSIKFEIWD
ncbi:MAG: hypothetical protein P9L92_05195 [Candidatus Electryonea clarkiae]|nr:hypothetical protein [Candidatus Electryonea clarkiae]MDP8286894.1 hypothetical protein [Candidatus Electryonea clarkiae]